jgi:hypothetical protein
VNYYWEKLFSLHRCRPTALMHHIPVTEMLLKLIINLISKNPIMCLNTSIPMLQQIEEINNNFENNKQNLTTTNKGVE